MSRLWLRARPALRAIVSHPGEKEKGLAALSPSLFQPQTYPRPSSPALSCPRPSPKRGGRPEVCWRLGEGRRLRAGVTPRSRETSGHRPGDTTVPARGASLGEAARRLLPAEERRPDEGNWLVTPSTTVQAAQRKRGLKSARTPKAERHGACEGWLNPFARILAQRMRSPPTRLAALRQPRHRQGPAAPAGRGSV